MSRGGLRLGKLYIPKSTLKGIGSVAKVVGKDAEKTIMLPVTTEQSLVGDIGAVAKGGGGSFFIIAIVCVGGFVAYKFATK